MTISLLEIPNQKGLRVIVQGRVRGSAGRRLIRKALESANHHDLVYFDFSKVTLIDRQVIDAMRKWKAENPEEFQKARMVNPSAAVLEALVDPGEALGIPIEIG